MGDIKRVFAYHGAEHKAISAHEAARPLTPDEVDRFSTAHTRCGTTFLLIVVVISIFFFSLIPRAGVPLPLLFLSRIALIPLIAAVASELVRFGASHYGNPAGARHLPARPVAAAAHHPPRTTRCWRSASPRWSPAWPPIARARAATADVVDPTAVLLEQPGPRGGGSGEQGEEEGGEGGEV